jgi:D-glycerate 3-kinase
VISLDDVYLTADERRDLAQRVHPLLATRGPPGTHDLALLARTLDALQGAEPDHRTALPRFDKRTDTRRPDADQPSFTGRPDLILVDGWCLGARPQAPEALVHPVNELERLEDPGGVWRGWVNARLAADYAPLWNRFDAILALDAPGWEVVPRWRMQQEEGLLGRPLDDRERAGVARFCAHFERITRSMMAGGRRADVAVRLDADRRVLGVAAG